MELNQLLEGSNNYKTLQADAARLSGKWAKSGLLEGISNEIEKNNMAMILENQAKQLVSEANTTNGNGGQEQWNGVALCLHEWVQNISGFQLQTCSISIDSVQNVDTLFSRINALLQCNLRLPKWHIPARDQVRFKASVKFILLIQVKYYRTPTLKGIQLFQLSQLKKMLHLIVLQFFEQ